MSTTIGQLLGTVSISKLEMANRCLQQFAFQYIERLPRQNRAAVQFGDAIDATGNGTYTSKKATGETPSRSDVQARFAADWDFSADAIDDWQGGTRGEWLDAGVRSVAVWRDRIAAFVQPAAVQEKITRTVVDPVSGESFGLTGYLDLRGAVQERAIVADLKSSGRSYRPDVFARRLQPVAYTLLAEIPTFEFHIIVPTKEPKTQVLRSTISDGDRVAFLRRAGMLRRQVRHAATTGDWLPNRSHTLCSRRYCEFWRECERRHGGRVAE